MSPPDFDPERTFHGPDYLRITMRRLEHLASLGLPLHSKSVLEIGAGIGDFTRFYDDRGCRVLATDPRPENLEVLRRSRWRGQVTIRRWTAEDLVAAVAVENSNLAARFDIVHAYGVLYHLADPEAFLRGLKPLLAPHGFVLLEGIVAAGDVPETVTDDIRRPDSGVNAVVRRLPRSTIHEALEAGGLTPLWPTRQPNHEDFPRTWPCPPRYRHPRCVVLAQRHPVHPASAVPDAAPGDLKWQRCPTGWSAAPPKFQALAV